jgi:hypothetical protein
MIELNYRIDPDDLSYAEVNRHRLSGEGWYDVYFETTFHGFQTFIVNGVDLSNGDIAIIHFAMCLLHAVLTFDNGGEIWEFCDIDSSLVTEFRLAGDRVRISENLGGTGAEVPLAAFKEAVLPYVRRVRKELEQQFPELCQNDRFSRLLDENRKFELLPPRKVERRNPNELPKE